MHPICTIIVMALTSLCLLGRHAAAQSPVQDTTPDQKRLDVAEDILQVVTPSRDLTPLPPGFLDASKGFDSLKRQIDTQVLSPDIYSGPRYETYLFSTEKLYTLALNVPRNVDVETIPNFSRVSELTLDLGRNSAEARRLMARLGTLWGKPTSSRGNVSIWRRVNMQPEDVMRPADQGDLAKVILTISDTGNSTLYMDRRAGGEAFAVRGGASSARALRSGAANPQSGTAQGANAKSSVDPVGDF